MNLIQITRKTVLATVSFKHIQLLSVIVILLVLASGCDDDEESMNPSITSDEVITVPFFIENLDKNPITDPAEKVYEFRKHQPVIAPDGHHLTMAEFSTVKGSISVACRDQGTQVIMNLTGLIPNGVYTIWNATFNENGFNPAVEDMNMIGLGAAGLPDGSQNTIVASSQGTGQISLVSPQSSLSMMGNISNCALDEYEWHVVGAYHIDGQTYGPDLGPDGTAVEQFAFIFK